MDRVEQAVGRVLDARERRLLTELEDAGLLVPDPEPVEDDSDLGRILASADCETVCVVPAEGNPYGYPAAIVHRSLRVGLECVRVPAYADVERDGRVVAWATVEASETIRPYSGHSLADEFRTMRRTGATVPVEYVARKPAEGDLGAVRGMREVR